MVTDSEVMLDNKERGSRVGLQGHKPRVSGVIQIM